MRHTLDETARLLFEGAMDTPASPFPERLTEGYRAFLDDRFDREKDRYEQLAETGQTPKILLIGCCDSRVSPEVIFDARPGEMFVVRNVANLVPPFEVDDMHHGVSAALEFAVTQLEVPEIVVMGHGQCGGVHAALTRRFEHAPPGEGGFIAHWIDLLDDARDRITAAHGGASAEAIRALELETVRVSIANLRTFPCIRKREAAGTLTLHGAYFAIADGMLHALDEATGEFSAV